MGFGLFYLFIFLPLSAMLLLAWLLTRKKHFGILLGFFWYHVCGFVVLVEMQRWLTENKDLKRKDYYGQYVVNRNFFKGRQADWQYNTFRFEIRNNDSIYFFVTDREDILETYRGSVTTTKSCRSERLIINMEQPTHHILSGNPTTYRSTWSFYLVFHSPKFNNVFFKKGTWKALEE